LFAPTTTTAQLATLVASRLWPLAETGDEAERSSLVWLRTAGLGPPIVFIHPVGGGVQCYQGIADALQCPVAAIEAPALRGDDPKSPRTVEAIAKRYLQMLNASSVAPPVALAGWSFGGLIAFEMATRLKADGRGAPFVVLLDAYVSSGDGTTDTRLRRSLRLAGADAATSPARELSLDAEMLGFFLRDLSPEGSLADDWLHELDAEAHEPANADLLVDARRLIGRAHARGLLRGLPEDDAVRMFEVFRLHVAAAERYRPVRYDGPVLLVAAERSGVAAADGWREIAPNLQVERIDADHYSLLSGLACDRLMTALSARLRERDARVSTSVSHAPVA
jgi:thioesterase domain-containing protein